MSCASVYYVCERRSSSATKPVPPRVAVRPPRGRIFSYLFAAREVRSSLFIYLFTYNGRYATFLFFYNKYGTNGRYRKEKKVHVFSRKMTDSVTLDLVSITADFVCQKYFCTRRTENSRFIAWNSIRLIYNRTFLRDERTTISRVHCIQPYLKMFFIHTGLIKRKKKSNFRKLISPNDYRPRLFECMVFYFDDYSAEPHLHRRLNK